MDIERANINLRNRIRNVAKARACGVCTSLRMTASLRERSGVHDGIMARSDREACSRRANSASILGLKR